MSCISSSFTSKWYMYFPFMGRFDRVCIWTAVMLFLMAMFNAAVILNKFTRFAGELFGMLITVLFMQQAIKVCHLHLLKSKFLTDLVLVTDYTACHRGCWVNSALLRVKTKVNRCSSSNGYMLMVCLELSFQWVYYILH